MSNVAAAQRLYTRGNNEALLQWIFPTLPPIVLQTHADDCRHMQMTADSHCFSEEEDNMPQAPYPRVD
jgi:hypothetical protein